MRRAHVALFVSLAVSAGALSACGSDTLEGSGSSGSDAPTAAADVKVDDAVAELVPADIKSKGTLSIGSDASYAPNEFLGDDGKTVEGMDVDLFTGAAAKMGLKTTWKNAPFDGLILGVDSNKYDVAVSSFTINDERKKQVSMISYFNAGTQWVTTKGNPGKVDPKDPCGKTVGVQKGTVQLDELTALNKKCDQKMKLVVEGEQSKVTASLVSGKTEAMAADSPISLYAVKQQGDELEALGDTYDSAPYGIVVPKDQTKFGEAIAAAFESMKKDGSYDAILKNWGNESGGIDSFAVNP
ncbi:ABC transporter substrate-binding protein [Janibacter sp. Soil728]|uniref:ABC transporter substrate-binding protein n=1 Tax=Janibacter sp. Soil728 TaxID=1736393 RepID=UPI0006FEA99F|nr:ABC transporter substrate-binding protein [Janibacter sp. Soil728]KRE39458.1 ABC transporter substrate-binding protein [Janibacter sp. Soil728]